MTHLNLVDLEKSDIKYQIHQYPDGQQSISILPPSKPEDLQQVLIDSRFNSFKDLELIICANQALRNVGAAAVGLHVPYFLGARSDRRFEFASVNYLKQVICPIINDQKFDVVVTLDPHSDVLEACLDRFEKAPNFPLVKFALKDIDNGDNAQDRICLVSPDAGAYKKIFDVAKEFNIETIVTANKVRDMKTGNILRTEVPSLPENESMKYVIVDDICDGGRTFVELAKVIKAQRPNAEIYLIVTHGIFSAGFELLTQYFNGIYCTNSVREVADDEYEVKTKTQTFNVF
jgi:ribose-phosphate pyrophosphokinase